MAVTRHKAAGAGRIFATDVNPERLGFAKKLGASMRSMSARDGIRG
ncbi:MAG: hypothetical protein KIT19_05705 [Phycisphaeraceae bacterium]|nr:hypothetical protein [Phycisphaeraceae bacterium]